MYSDIKERYFAPAKYNMVRVINVLATLVERHGGKVKRTNETLHIHTRGYDAKILDLQRIYDSLSNRLEPHDLTEGEAEKKRKTLENISRKITDIENMKKMAPVIETSFISLISDLWIRFELNGCTYYFEVDDNPFFPDKFLKGKTGESIKRYMEEIECDKKTYYLNGIFEPVAEEKTILIAASDLYTLLTEMELGEIVKEEMR